MSGKLRARQLVLGATAVALGVVAVGSLGATASAGPPACPQKTLCIYEQVKGGGEVVKITDGGISNKLATKMDDEASSVINRRRGRAYLYEKEDGKGRKVCISPHDSIAGLVDYSFDNLASSSKNSDNENDCPAGRKRASAARGDNCPNGFVCLWEDQGYAGNRIKIKDERGVSNKVADEMNNAASSLSNQGDHAVRIYDRKNAKGIRTCFEAGGYTSSLGDAGFNDRASSTKVIGKELCNAKAPTARGSCPNTFCVFTEQDFGGTEVDVTKLGISNKVDNKIPGQARSVVNDRDGATFFYRKRDGKGRTMCINSGDSLSDVAEVQLSGFSSTRLIERKTCFPHR